MLPRSLLSTSSLTSDQKEAHQMSTPNNARTKRRRFSDAEIGMDEGSGSDSSSESDSDISNLYGNYSLPYLQNDIGALQNQIQLQQTKQKRLMRKVQSLDKDIRRNTKKLGRLTRLLITPQHQQHQQHPQSSSANSLQLPIKRSDSKGKIESTAVDGNTPLFRTTLSNTLHHPSSATKQTTRTESSTTKTTQPLPVSRSSSSISSNNSSATTPKPSTNSDLAYTNTLDTIVRRQVTTLKSGFDRKVRRLLCHNEDATMQHMQDLLVSTSLDGEVQFWNANEKKRIDKLGGDMIFKDNWVEDLCWGSPTSLALIPSSKDGSNTQSVVVLDMNWVDRNSVKGDIETLNETPHGTKGFDVITSAYTGNHSRNNNMSFVTAGGDKSIYLWNLSRSDPEDTFKEELHCLDVPHTNRIQALCFNKHDKTLYSGGSDQKFYAFDVEKRNSIYGFTIGNRINSINVNDANPNYALLGLSRTDNQFCMYDKRCSTKSGIKLQFGAVEEDNMSKYGQPDWHNNGYTVLYGSQSGPRLNFWDIRYTGIGKGPSFTITPDPDISNSKTKKVLQSVFLPGRSTVAMATASRALVWMDYQLISNCKPTPSHTFF